MFFDNGAPGWCSVRAALPQAITKSDEHRGCLQFIGQIQRPCHLKRTEFVHRPYTEHYDLGAYQGVDFVKQKKSTTILNVNPLIYTILNDSFTNYFKNVLGVPL